MRFALFVLAFCLILGCCGYSTKALLPPHLKTVAIVPVENQTSKPGLEVAMTQKLAESFQRDGSLKVADIAKADVTVRCRLTSYSRTPQTYDANQKVSVWLITLDALMDAQDLAKSQTLWSGSLSVSATYPDSSKTEDQGVADALDKLVGEVVRHTLIAW